MQVPVYMDCHATTPMDRRVVDAMLPFFTEVFGNPGSTSHRFGEEAKAAVEQARHSLAGNLGTTASGAGDALSRLRTITQRQYSSTTSPY